PQDRSPSVGKVLAAAEGFADRTHEQSALERLRQKGDRSELLRLPAEERGIVRRDEDDGSCRAVLGEAPLEVDAGRARQVDVDDEAPDVARGSALQEVFGGTGG